MSCTVTNPVIELISSIEATSVLASASLISPNTDLTASILTELFVVLKISITDFWTSSLLVPSGLALETASNI